MKPQKHHSQQVPVNRIIVQLKLSLQRNKKPK